MDTDDTTHDSTDDSMGDSTGRTGRDGTIREPGNSTVDDWLGQKVERDRALAERLLSETGDFDEARRRFEQEREGPRPESLPTEERRT